MAFQRKRSSNIMGSGSENDDSDAEDDLAVRPSFISHAPPALSGMQHYPHTHTHTCVPLLLSHFPFFISSMVLSNFQEVGGGPQRTTTKTPMTITMTTILYALTFIPARWHCALTVAPCVLCCA